MAGNIPPGSFGQTPPRRATPSASSVASLVLSGAGLIVAPLDGGVALVGTVAAWIGGRVSDEQISRLGNVAADHDARLGGLERAANARVHLRTEPARLLAECLAVESSQLFTYLDANLAMERLGLSAEQYREAAEELEAIGLTEIHANLNHASGISRTVLTSHAVFSLANALAPAINMAEEVRRVLQALQSSPNRMRIADLIDITSLPPPWLDLILRGLEELDLVRGYGPGDPRLGSHLDVEIRPLGKRVARGDDPFAA